MARLQRAKRAAVAVCVAVTLATALGACTQESSPNPTYATSTIRRAAAPPIVGVNFAALWQDMTPEVRASTLDDLKSIGVEWIRLDVAWAMLQPERRGENDLAWGVPQVDLRIKEITDRGFKILFTFYWAPKWSSGTSAKNGVPGSPRDYAAALDFATRRWANSVDAWEIWNEPDSPTFWARPSAEAYTRLLKVSYPIVKVNDPAAPVVAGAPTYVNTAWYAALYRNGAKGSFDIVGIHPYMSPGDLSPDAPDDGTMWRIRHIDSLLLLMKKYGALATPIWATEMGWSSNANTAETKPWQRGVSAGLQAEYLQQGLALLAKYPQVQAAFWYTARDSDEASGNAGDYGLMERDGDAKPALNELNCVLAGRCWYQ